MRRETRRRAEVKVGNWVHRCRGKATVAAGDTDSLLGLCQKPLGLMQIAAGVVCIATKTTYLILAGSMEKQRLWVDVAINDIPTPAGGRDESMLVLLDKRQKFRRITPGNIFNLCPVLVSLWLARAWRRRAARSDRLFFFFGRSEC